MFSGEFYENRKTAIEERISEIKKKWTLDQLCKYMLNNWYNHEAEMAELMSYKIEDNDFLDGIIRSIGSRVLAAVCKRFATNFRLYKAGLPDLFLWNPKEKKVIIIILSSLLLFFVYIN